MADNYQSVAEGIEELSRYDRCRHAHYGFYAEDGKRLGDPEQRCYEDISHLIPEGAYEVVDDKKCENCPDFVSQYLEFPLEIADIKKKETLYDGRNCSGKCGQLVAVRPCDKACGGKTYLGFFVGDLPTNIHVTYNSDSKVLTVNGSMSNPCILIPELGRLVWGYESWWHKIESADELKQITDDDIDNVWYVKALEEQVAAAGDETD
ncbi:MAG: hypothetical protein IJH04_01825 [Eggerthellaceae bacterium]|nr:hypothetical protein [Eggerthellaceae bacterium]